MNQPDIPRYVRFHTRDGDSNSVYVDVGLIELITPERYDGTFGRLGSLVSIRGWPAQKVSERPDEAIELVRKAWGPGDERD